MVIFYKDHKNRPEPCRMGAGLFLFRFMITTLASAMRAGATPF